MRKVLIMIFSFSLISCSSTSLRDRMFQQRELADTDQQSKSKPEHFRNSVSSSTIKGFKF